MSTSQARPERPADHQSPSIPTCISEYVGDVTVTGPTIKGYYRLKWREPDGTLRDTSGSRDLDFARVKAADIDARLARAAGPKATCYLQHILDESSPMGTARRGDDAVGTGRRVKHDSAAAVTLPEHRPGLRDHGVQSGVSRDLVAPSYSPSNSSAAATRTIAMRSATAASRFTEKKAVSSND